MDPFYFTFADQDTFDDVSRWRCRPDDPRFRRTRQGVVPVQYRPGWDFVERGIWTVCSPTSEALVQQGWKLHVAVTPDSFEPLLRTVSAVCYDRGVAFKHLARFEYAWLVNAKYAPRAGSGKGIVLYPESTDLAVELGVDLADRLRGVDGPRILSDLRIDGTVVHARYGAYVTRYCRDADGRVQFAMSDPDGELVPDRRTVPFAAPSFVQVPEAFHPSAQTPAQEELPPYQVDKTLHFSNSGGVYLATHIGSGREVVLKEARPFAGYDLVGGDAVARAGREVDAMRRLADQPEVPEVYEQFTWQSHVFTAMEYVRGNTLQEWCAANHPYLLRSDPFAAVTDDEAAWYRDRIESILGRLERLVQVVWERGYVVGDLHPGNVMVTPELDVRLLDLEACLPREAERPFPGVPGFIDFRRSGRASDEFGLAMLRLSCYLPLTQLIRMDNTKLGQLLATARAWFRLPAEWADAVLAACEGGFTATAVALAGTARVTEAPAGPAAGPDGPARCVAPSAPFATWSGELLAGLAATITEDRTDRLFPGDPTGFALPPVATATGAAGVLWALLPLPGEEAADLRRRTADWVAVAGRAAARRPECGLFDSALGAGYVLRRAGYLEHARWLVAAALSTDRSSSGLGVFGGLAGTYLAVVALAEGPDPLLPEVLVAEVGDELVRRAAGLLDDLRSANARTVRYGLLHGLAGIALATHRHGLRCGDAAAVACARGLLEHELAAYVRCKDGSLQYNEADRRSLAYLEEGSCGAALVLAELTEHDAFEVPGVTVVDLVRALAPEVMFQCGLFRGRAGFLAGVAQLARAGYQQAEPLVGRHLGQLPLHEVRPRPGELHVPGSGNYRISCDLRTGSAGVLTAVAYAGGHRNDWLPAVF